MTREEEIENLRYFYAPNFCETNLEVDISFETFKSGIQWADEHPNNRWISVEDRLPEQNKKVIVICEKLDTAPFYKISLGHIVDKTICKDNYNGWDIPNVVYWTPMPKLPEEI